MAKHLLSKSSLLSTLLAVALLTSASGSSAAVAKGEDVWHERGNGAKDVVALPSLAPLVKETGKAVLTITVEAEAPTNKEPVFKGFGLEFRLPDMPPMKGQGSGFLIHESGYALTNNHVIENASVIKVSVGGSQEVYDAKVIGTDPKTDVALIKIESKKNDWPYIPLGSSDALEVGDFVVAIGNPFGLSQTVSTGIISAQHRRNIAPSGRHGLYDFLQTDASINPGNSGGPLINLKGEVVGINAAVNAAGQGLGFAIPIDLVKQLIPPLKEKGAVSRSWLGVGIRPVTPDIAEGLGLKRPRGALVAQVVEDGPAGKAGIEPGDVITTFDGQEINDASDLPLLAAHAGVGKKVKVSLMRDGKQKFVDITLGEMPSDGETAPAASTESSEEAGKLGIQVQDLDADARKQLKLKSSVKGALVVGVAPHSAAFDAGLRRGDIVLKVNGKSVASAKAFVTEVKGVASKKLIKLLVKRGDATVFVAMPKP